jgi:hypothetical protein
METTYTRERNDMCIKRRLRCHSPAVWRVLLEAKMTTVLMEIGDVVRKKPMRVGLVQDDDVVQELPTYGTNEPFREWIFQGAR